VRWLVGWIDMTIDEIAEAMNNCAAGKCNKCPIDCKKLLIEYLGNECRKLVEQMEDDCKQTTRKEKQWQISKMKV